MVRLLAAPESHMRCLLVTRGLLPENLRIAATEKVGTFGDRLWKRRLDLRLPQRAVADRVDAAEASVWQWENNRMKPQIRFIPDILLHFLGRRELGFSRRRLAAELG